MHISAVLSLVLKYRLLTRNLRPGPPNGVGWRGLMRQLLDLLRAWWAWGLRGSIGCGV